MSGVMVSVATGVMTSVIDKLTSLVGEEYKLLPDVRRGIRFMRDELSSMNAALQRLAEMDDDQIDVQTKEWRTKVRELSYDIEDCIDRFIQLHSSSKAKLNFAKSMVRKIKELWEDRQIAKEIQELKALIVEEKERRDRYNIDQYLTMTRPVLLDPRAPMMYEKARDLVGIDGPREEIIGWIMGGESQLKVVSIFGMGGLGKTTLAMEVYHKINRTFDCCALVTVSRTLDIKKLLRDVIFQINKCEYNMSENWETEQLILTLQEFLSDKKYLIVIDDIWSTSAWEYVKSALPDSNNGSRLITTTRIKGVARSCCISIDGHMYEAKPLSADDSRTLLFRRMFCSNEDCPGALTEVAKDILRKCGGLPLAIISIAGLLANRSPTVEAWVKVLNSISTAVEKDSPIERMKRILLLSYYDLPHYLKTCFLYMSVFPEDYKIDARYLIWRWIAEGLIPGHTSTINMEELGESYLNELINRSMVQPTKIGADGKKVKFCRLHDVILDFIISQADEDNFVTVWNVKDVCGNYSNKIRRLCIIGTNDTYDTEEMAKAIKNLYDIRSVNIFWPYVLQRKVDALKFLNGQVLRVLNVDANFYPLLFQAEHVESFAQLKYLRIECVSTFMLPEAVGKLQHLETLDVRGADSLPASIVQLQKLVRLFVSAKVQLPDGIGNLQALEELSKINLCKASAKSIQGLGYLSKLRVLRLITKSTFQERVKICISALSKLLMSLQTLDVGESGFFADALMASESEFTHALISSRGWTPPLQRLVLPNSKFSSVPSAISLLVNLTRLKFKVYGEVSKEGLGILAGLPMLTFLTVELRFDWCTHTRHVIGKQGFQRLVKFHFKCDDDFDAALLKFDPGAMKKLQRLKLTLKAQCQFMYRQGGLVLGLQNLSNLKHVFVGVDCYGTSVEEVENLENDIRDAAGAHPNSPILEVKRERAIA